MLSLKSIGQFQMHKLAIKYIRNITDRRKDPNHKRALLFIIIEKLRFIKICQHI